MAKLTRVTQKIFASTPGFDQVAEFGSLNAGSPTFSNDPATIQSLSNWLVGWYDAVIGGNSPAIEDMNAFCFVHSRQIAYLLQAGIAEWDSGTTYYIGSLANDGINGIYASVTDNNLNHILTDTSNWIPIVPPLGSPFEHIGVNAAGTAAEYTYNTFNKITAPSNLTIPAAYNLNTGNLTIPNGVTYVVDGSMTAIGPLTVVSGATLTISPGAFVRIV